MPGRQAQQHVAADEPGDLWPPPPLKFSGGLNGVAWPAAAEFEVIDGEERIIRHRQPCHGQPVLGCCQIDIPGLMWRLTAWDEQDVLEPRLLGGRAGGDEV